MIHHRRSVVFVLALALFGLVAVSWAAEETVYFNVQSKKFHCLSCQWAKRCTRNCVKVSRSEALRRGGVACKVCGGTCGHSSSIWLESGTFAPETNPGLPPGPPRGISIPPAGLVALATTILILAGRLGLVLLSADFDDDLLDLGRSRRNPPPPTIWLSTIWLPTTWRRSSQNPPPPSTTEPTDPPPAANADLENQARPRD